MLTDRNDFGTDLMRAVNEVTDYAVFLIDRKGTIVSWNQGAERITGYEASEAIGKSHKILFSPEDLIARLPDIHLEKTISGESTRFEGWRIRRDGSRFWCSVSTTALRTSRGDLSGFIKVIDDLSETMTAEEEAIIRHEELKESHEALRKSEEKYHRLISEIPDCSIFLLDKEGIIADWNKGAERLTFYKSADIIGRNFRIFYPQEDRDAKVPESLLSTATKNGSVSHEGWRVRKDGSRFWGLVSISAIYDTNGAVSGFTNICRDLTERKRAEDRLNSYAEVLRQANDALRQSEEQYHRMISEVRDYAIILLDKHGNIQNWNAGAEHIKLYKADEVIGKSFKLFYTPALIEEGLPERLLAEAEMVGRSEHEGWRLKKDGTRFWGSVVITALHDEAGNVVGYSKVTRDLTRRKQADDELQENARRLDEKNRILSQLNEELASFNYVASHDLKEPLRKILTFISLIERGVDPPERNKEFLEKIKRSAMKSMALIDDLLSLSRVSNDRSRFEMVDLNETVTRAKEELDLIIREKKATITVENLPTISGVSFQLDQLFINLLSNALKFSRLSPMIRINYTFGEYQTPDSVPMACHQVSVVDNGKGFDQQYASYIFGAFQRLESASTSTGSGIGLAIVKKVMGNHGGWVSAEGRPGEGATFNLYFPAVSKTFASDDSGAAIASQESTVS